MHTLPDIHFIDFEGSTRTGIVELGVATLHRGQIRLGGTRICRPRQPMFTREIDIHGISNREAEECPPIKEDWAWFRDLRRSGLFGAHNQVVENNLLHQVWPHGGWFPSFSTAPDQAGWGPWIDTRWLAPNLFRDLESCKLMDLIEQFRLQPTLEQYSRELCPPRRCQPHCALFDALASAVLFQHFIAIEAFAGFGIEDWLAHSTPPQTQEQLNLF